MIILSYAGFYLHSLSCQRISDLGMIILCLKGHNSQKFMRSWSLVLSHSSISMKLWEEVFWPKWVAPLPHLTACLDWNQIADYLQSFWNNCMIPLELSVSRVRVLIAGIISSKRAGMVFNKQNIFPWRQEERGSLSANAYPSKSKSP